MTDPVVVEAARLFIILFYGMTIGLIIGVAVPAYVVWALTRDKRQTRSFVRTHGPGSGSPGFYEPGTYEAEPQYRDDCEEARDGS